MVVIPCSALLSMRANSDAAGWVGIRESLIPVFLPGARVLAHVPALPNLGRSTTRSVEPALIPAEVLAERRRWHPDGNSEEIHPAQPYRVSLFADVSFSLFIAGGALKSNLALRFHVARAAGRVTLQLLLPLSG